MTMQRTDERRAAPARSPTTLRSAEPMFVVDASSRIVVWNERAAELFGFPADEALGRPCWEVVRGLTPEHRRYCAPECAVIRCGERGSAPRNPASAAKRHAARNCPPIVVLTGRADDAWLAKWSRASAAVPHPIDPIQLTQEVVALLRAARG